MVQFDTIKLCGTCSTFLVSSCGLKKSHYNTSRVSLHEAQTKNRNQHGFRLPHRGANEQIDIEQGIIIPFSWENFHHSILIFCHMTNFFHHEDYISLAHIPSYSIRRHFICYYEFKIDNSKKHDRCGDERSLPSYRIRAYSTRHYCIIAMDKYINGNNRKDITVSESHGNFLGFGNYIYRAHSNKLGCSLLIRKQLNSYEVKITPREGVDCCFAAISIEKRKFLLGSIYVHLGNTENIESATDVLAEAYTSFKKENKTGPIIFGDWNSRRIRDNLRKTICLKLTQGQFAE